MLPVMPATAPVASTTSLALMKLAPLTVMPYGLAMITLAASPTISNLPAKLEALLTVTSLMMTRAATPPKFALAPNEYVWLLT